MLMEMGQGMNMRLTEIRGAEELSWIHFKDTPKGIITILSRIRSLVDEHGIAIIAALGLTSSVKGGLCRGLNEMIRADDKFSDVTLYTSHHSMSARAVKTEKAREEFPDLWVDPSMKPGTYSPHIYRKISKFHWEVLKRSIDQSQKSGEKSIFLVEGGGLASYPNISSYPPHIPLEDDLILGVDRGNSPIFNLALSSDTRNKMLLFLTERIPRITDYADSWRRKVIQRQIGSMTEMTDEQTDITRLILRTNQGFEFEISSLPDEEVKAAIFKVMSSLSLPPDKRPAADSNFEDILEYWGYPRVIDKTSQEIFFKELDQNLRNPRHVIWAIPEFNDGERTNFVNYFFDDSIFVKRYPGTIPQIILDFKNNN